MAKKAKKAAARKPNAAFMKPVTPSAALAEVVGSKPIPRTEVTKRLWAYIKKNKLQDAKNKRMIKADGTLPAQLHEAWGSLSRACHHHPYELAPTAGELATWIHVVEEFGRRRERP